MNDQQMEQSNKPPFHEAPQSVNALIGACQIMGRLVEVFLRWPGSWGERFCGFQMVFSWIIALVWGPLLFPAEDPRPMMWFWLAATVMLIVHRIAGVWRRNRGYWTHSLDRGMSLLGKAEREVMLLICLGLLALLVSIPLGAYLLTATMGLWVSEAWQRTADKARLRSLRDARADQEWLMRQMQDEV